MYAWTLSSCRLTVSSFLHLTFFMTLNYINRMCGIWSNCSERHKNMFIPYILTFTAIQFHPYTLKWEFIQHEQKGNIVHSLHQSSCFTLITENSQMWEHQTLSSFKLGHLYLAARVSDQAGFWDIRAIRRVGCGSVNAVVCLHLLGQITCPPKLPYVLSLSGFWGLVLVWSPENVINKTGGCHQCYSPWASQALN